MFPSYQEDKPLNHLLENKIKVKHAPPTPYIQRLSDLAYDLEEDWGEELAKKWFKNVFERSNKENNAELKLKRISTYLNGHNKRTERWKNFLEKQDIKTKGDIYIFSNPAYGSLKIGSTSKSPEKRSESLYTTGVPARFEIEYERFTFDIDGAEKYIKKKLDKVRANKGREFFDLPLAEAIGRVSHLITEHELKIYDRFKDFERGIKSTLFD